MSRTVKLGGPGPPPDDRDAVVTPNSNAARALGVEHVSLERLAREVVGEGRIADPLLLWRVLRESVAEVLEPRDVAATARSLQPVARELFRSGADFDRAPHQGGPDTLLS